MFIIYGEMGIVSFGIGEAHQHLHISTGDFGHIEAPDLLRRSIESLRKRKNEVTMTNDDVIKRSG